MTSTHRQRLIRLILPVFALAWFAGTHMPRPPRIPSGLGGDKTVHFVGYAIMMTLALSATANVKLPAVRRITLWLLAGLLFAALDEITQPLVNRTCSFTDFLADAAGLFAAIAAVALADARRRRRLT